MPMIAQASSGKSLKVEGRTEESKEQPEWRKAEKKDGLDHRISPEGLERLEACLGAIRLLSQSAAQDTANAATAQQHLQSIALLCRSCLQGGLDR